MSSAATPTLPGSDERDAFASGEHEIVDLHEGREHPDQLLIQRLENFRHTTTSRLKQLFTWGRYDPERAAIDDAIAQRAEERRRLRSTAAVAAPLRNLAKKADTKLEILRDQDRGYRHVVDYYQGLIRRESPEPKSTLGRWWKWVAGEGAHVKEYRRKLAVVEGARKATADKLAADPREAMQREFAVDDRSLRLQIIQRAPQLAPQLPELLHALAAGNAEPLRTAVRGVMPADEADSIMGVAQRLRGEYAGVGWRALGALGTVFTLGFNKDARALAVGSRNERSVQLASFYARQADEQRVYNQLSVAGQMRTLTSLPAGSVLIVGGQQMAVEKVQEKKGRRAVRLVQLDDARQVFLLDVANPDAPVLRRAVGRGRELPLRAYRDARSPLPSFAPAESRVAAAPEPVSAVSDRAFAAITSGDTAAVQAALAALNARLAADVLPGDDPSALQEARAEAIAAINLRLTAAGLPARVRLDGDEFRLSASPLPPVADPDDDDEDDDVPDPAVEREATIIRHTNQLLAALEIPDLATRLAAARAALAPLQAMATAAASDDEAAAVARRATELITQVYTDAGEPVPAAVEISGRALQLVYIATPAAVPSAEEERLTDLMRRVDLLITAFNSDPVRRLDVMQRVLNGDLRPLAVTAANDAAAADLVREMNELVADAYGADIPFTIVLGPGRLLSLEFPAALVLTEDNLREEFADGLEAPVDRLRTLNAEHQLPENRASHQWWDENGSRYVLFRNDSGMRLRAEIARTSDPAYRAELESLMSAIETTIDPRGNFPGGHPAIEALLRRAGDLQRSLRPPAGVA